MAGIATLTFGKDAVSEARAVAEDDIAVEASSGDVGRVTWSHKD